jgi:hypothetical protein
LSVTDTREIGTLGYRLSPRLCGRQLNNPKVVMDSTCVAQTSRNLFERKSDFAEDFNSRKYARLGVSARNTQCVYRIRGSVDLGFTSGTILIQRSRAALPRPSRSWGSLRTTLKKGRGSSLHKCRSFRREN